jgi:hypothetical protein
MYTSTVPNKCYFLLWLFDHFHFQSILASWGGLCWNQFLDIVSLYIDVERIPIMDQYNSVQFQLTSKVVRILVSSTVAFHKESCLWNYILQRMPRATACFWLQKWQKHRCEKLDAIYDFGLVGTFVRLLQNTRVSFIIMNMHKCLETVLFLSYKIRSQPITEHSYIYIIYMLCVIGCILCSKQSKFKGRRLPALQMNVEYEILKASL